MRMFLASAALVAVSVSPQPALVQATPAAASKCDRLKSEWRGYEISMAQTRADGVTDNSAPRATMRAAQETATLAQASITLQLMQANKCALPDAAPSSIIFFLEALQCQTKMIGASSADIRAGIPECDTSKWTGIAPK